MASRALLMRATLRTGASVLERQDAQTLHVDRFVEGLEAVRNELGSPIRLLGHSWGATLALRYATRYPRDVAGCVLVGLGPLNAELANVARANLIRPLSPAERNSLERLRVQRRAAVEAGDLAAHAKIHCEMVTRCYIKSWFYSPTVARHFARQFLADYANNPIVGQYAAPSVDYQALWSQLARVVAPVLVVYGHQDFEPIVQGYLLRERIPQTRIVLLNECGHVLWLEQPAAFRQQVLKFLLLCGCRDARKGRSRRSAPRGWCPPSSSQ